MGWKRLSDTKGALGVIPLLLLFTFVAAVIYPIRPLQVISLALAACVLFILAVLVAAKKSVSAGWSKLLGLASAGVAMWWPFWIPRLLLPLTLQILCRAMAVGLGFLAAAVLYRSLPGHIRILGPPFSLVPLVLAFLLPFGPERWTIEPLTIEEAQFHGRHFLVRTGEGPLLVYDFPEMTLRQVIGFLPYRHMSLPSFSTTLPGWSFALAVLESGGGVEVRFPGEVRLPGLDLSAFSVQTESELIALMSGPKSTFITVYRTEDGRPWLQLRDARWAPASLPIPLPGFPSFKNDVAISGDRSKIAYLDRDSKFQRVRVIDLSTGESHSLLFSQEIAALGGGEGTYIASIAFSPDGKGLALGLSWKGGADCPGLVWRVDLEGKVLARFLPPTPEELRHDPDVWILAHDPSGRRLLAGICCRPRRLVVIDMDSGRVRDLPLGGLGFDDAFFSPDGHYLVATKPDGIYIWKSQ